MRILRGLDNLPDEFRSGAVAVGNFDGVHLGHAEIARRLVAVARRLGGPAVVFTFDPHPVQVLRPGNSPPPLTQTDRKAQLLAELGVDAVVAYPTNAALLALDPRQFFDRIVRQRLRARALVEGTNFFFGRGRSGNVEVLKEFCAETGVMLELVEPVPRDGQAISSSRIRDLLGRGEVEPARRMLTRPYRLRGTVIYGAGRGAQLGYPTANLADVRTLVPGEGIYAGRALADGFAWPAAISLGPNPTFDEGGLKIEVHLIGYQGLLYDRPLEVDFLARLRGVERFASVEELIAQMDRDVAVTRRIVENDSSEASSRYGPP